MFAWPSDSPAPWACWWRCHLLTHLKMWGWLESSKAKTRLSLLTWSYSYLLSSLTKPVSLLFFFFKHIKV